VRPAPAGPSRSAPGGLRAPFLRSIRKDHTSFVGIRSLGHWLFFAVMVAVILYPVGRILKRWGLSPFWSVLALIPVVNLISLWTLAFTEWPAERAKAAG
jgi:hypothetical protein